MKKVVISDYYYPSVETERKILSDAGCAVFDYHVKTEDALIDCAADCDGLLVQFAPVTRRVIRALTRCKVIVRYAIGVDTIDLAAADEAGIIVCNVPDYCIDEVSMHAVTLLLACARRLPVLTCSPGGHIPRYTAATPLQPFHGARVGLLGFGAIARAVAAKLSGFSPDICAFDPYADKDAAAALGVTLVDLDTLLTKSDYISIHCPLTDATRGLLNADAFSRMKRGVVIINTARGAIIDEAALLHALDDGTVSAAGLDVLLHEPVSEDDPLLARENVIVTPHVAWYSEAAVASLQRKAAEEIARVLGGMRPLHMVNHPKL